MQLSFNEGKKNFNHNLHDRYQVWKNQIEWKLNGEFHRVNGPAIPYQYFQKGKRHSLDSPSMIIDDTYWYVNGVVHKINDPAIKYSQDNMYYYLYGRIYAYKGTIYIAYRYGQMHRDHGPAIILEDGTQEWYLNGQLHREDGPAAIKANGTQYWFLKGQLHRIDGPAIIKKDGSQEFWINGQRKDL